MSEEDGGEVISVGGIDDAEQHYLTAEYKDVEYRIPAESFLQQENLLLEVVGSDECSDEGQLQIVEVTPFEKDKGSFTQSNKNDTKRMYALLKPLPKSAQSQLSLTDVQQDLEGNGSQVEESDLLSTTQEGSQEISILPDDGEPTKLMLGRNENGLVQLDLLNLTLIKCEDGEESYRLVTSVGSEGADLSDGCVTCVLQPASDGDDNENQESYVMVEDGNTLPVYFSPSESDQPSETYTQPDESPPAPAPQSPPPAAPAPPRKPLSPAELLQRAKAMKKARQIMSSVAPVRYGKRGRRAKATADLPMVQKLLASPQFKLYLYSCKLCVFKCNAVKQLQAHRASAHGSGAAKGKPRAALQQQCAQCPYRASSEEQLMAHVQIRHINEDDSITNQVSLDSKEVEEADVLVCGACGFESSCRHTFSGHIRDRHGAVALVNGKPA